MCHYLFTRSGVNAGDTTETIITALHGALDLMKITRQMFPGGPPDMPAEYDVWLYEAIEGEDAGLDKPPAKPRHYSDIFDSHLECFLFFRTAISTMRVLELPGLKVDKKPVLREVMDIGELITERRPNSHTGWHCRAWAAEDWGGMAKGYDRALKVAREEDKVHKVFYLYRYVECIMRRGHFRMGDMRKLYTEARKMDRELRLLGLESMSDDKMLVKSLMKTTPTTEDGRLQKKGVTKISYSSEEEYQRKVAAMELEAQLKGRQLVMHKDIALKKGELFCDECKAKFLKLLMCSRCKKARYVHINEY
jgi:hypothetical protein